MLLANLWRLITVSISYLVLIFGLSVIIMKPAVKDRVFSDRVLQYFIVGNFYVMNVVFLLLFIKCTSRPITIAVMVAGAFLIRSLYCRTAFLHAVANEVRTLALLVSGIYGWKLYWRNKIVSVWKRIFSDIFSYIKANVIETVIFLFCIGCQFYYYGYRLVYYSSFGIFDESVHLLWIQKMLDGMIFSDGIYPFGFHNVLYAVIKVFGFKAFTVVRYYCFILAIMLMIMLYILLKKICRSRYVPLIGFFLFTCTSLFRYEVVYRLQFTLPQEFGILFLYPMAIFLFYYLCNKNRRDLVLFGISFSLTLYAHYYITLIALVLCLGIAVSSFIRIFKEKLFLKLIICGLISTLIGILPMGIGLAMGYGMQGSIYWALGVMNNDEEDETEEEGQNQLQEDQNQLQEEQNQQEEAQNQLQDGQNQLQKEIADKNNKNILNRIVDKMSFVAGNIKSQVTNYTIEEILWMLLIISFFFVFLNTFLRMIIRCTKDVTFLQMGFMLYIFGLMILLCAPLLELPEIIESGRINEFLGYAIPIQLCMFLELIYELSEKYKKIEIGFNIITLLVLGACIITVYISGNSKKLGSFSLQQTDSAVKVIYDIYENFEDGTWTIVSSVDEYSIIYDAGYHHELLDFIVDIEDFSKDSSIYIPTKDVFFFIEKRPLMYSDPVYLGGSNKVYPEITQKDAQASLPRDSDKRKSEFYKAERNIIMAKAYYWAQKYREYFPSEMSVYYEDDDFICYRLRQDMYYLNNLAIDYGYNTR